jgi:phosphoesterase RecJ-like protein
MGLNTGKDQIGLYEKLIEFIGRHDFFLITTHDPADADGLGAQLVLACILRKQGKQFHIVNASPMPKQFRFMDPDGIVESWDVEKHGTLPEQMAVIMVDTADMHTLGQMRDAVCRAKEVFFLDHHEIISNPRFLGICDSSAASTCELAVELAEDMGVALDLQSAFAAYIGIAYDTGFFAYPKTTPRTFRAALVLLGVGVKPHEVHRHLNENMASTTMLLQQKAVSSLTLHCDGRVATQVLRQKDFAETGAARDETSGFVNFPLKCSDIVVSLMLKEDTDGKVRCSLRSKEGTVNVSKVAYEFGGGGHITAAGFKSSLSIDQALAVALAKISEVLGKQ